MKIEILKKDLVSLIVKTQNIAEKKNNMPVLVNILIEAGDNVATVYATDLEVSLTNTVPAKTLQPGKVVVNSRSLNDIVRELNEDVITLTKKENHWLEIHQRKYASKIVGINPEEYPVFPVYSGDKFTTFDTATLKEMIDKTIFSVSTDETRYHLNGIFFDQMMEGEKSVHRMVATDGHRLSVVQKPAESSGVSLTNEGVIIPRKGINEIRKMLDMSSGSIDLAVDGPQIIAKNESTILMVRLIEAKYPNYQRLIPEVNKYRITFQREEFLGTLKRVALLANQKSKGVTFGFSKNHLSISSNNPELGDAVEELDIDYPGSDMKLAFNARFFSEALSAIESDKVDFEFSDQISAGIIKIHNSDQFLCLVMPMKV